MSMSSMEVWINKAGNTEAFCIGVYVPIIKESSLVFTARDDTIEYDFDQIAKESGMHIRILSGLAQVGILEVNVKTMKSIDDAFTLIWGAFHIGGDHVHEIRVSDECLSANMWNMKNVWNALLPGELAKKNAGIELYQQYIATSKEEILNLVETVARHSLQIKKIQDERDALSAKAK